MPKMPAFGLIVTRGHQHDALVLSEWIHQPFAFLGLIGSRRKARIIREQFLRQKLATAEQFDRVACPVGMDIAAVGTHEIAVSIMAQFIQKRANTIVGHLIRQWRELGAGQIAVVHRPDNDTPLVAELDRLDFPAKDRIANPQPERGMFSSIVCAADWSGWRSEIGAWAIVLGDQPHLHLRRCDHCWGHSFRFARRRDLPARV